MAGSFFHCLPVGLPLAGLSQGSGALLVGGAEGWSAALSDSSFFLSPFRPPEAA